MAFGKWVFGKSKTTQNVSAEEKKPDHKHRKIDVFEG